MTLPTLLTLLRIALVPVLVVLFYLPYGWSNLASVIVFVLAAVTDWADGYVARRSGQLPSRDEVIAQGNPLPELRLDLHVYAENPAERFVFINMRKLREGEALPEGVRVEQITPDGVDLFYQGKRFALAGR